MTAVVPSAAIGEDFIIDFEGSGTDGENILSHFRGPLEVSTIDASTSVLPASKSRR